MSYSVVTELLPFCFVYQYSDFTLVLTICAMYMYHDYYEYSIKITVTYTDNINMLFYCELIIPAGGPPFVINLQN